MGLNFLLASGNPHKAQEFTKIFDPQIVTIHLPSQKMAIPETGQSFAANAFQKAEGYYQKFKTPVMADDSGLSVTALPEELGLHSARFGGPGLSDRQRAELLLQKLKEKKREREEERQAVFTCVLCFYLNPQEIFYFEGQMEGHIAHHIQGEEGFGYDPVFIPKHHPSGKTLAMLSHWKMKNSHRFWAAQHAQRFLASFTSSSVKFS